MATVIGREEFTPKSIGPYVVDRRSRGIVIAGENFTGSWFPQSCPNTCGTRHYSVGNSRYRAVDLHNESINKIQCHPGVRYFRITTAENNELTLDVVYFSDHRNLFGQSMVGREDEAVQIKLSVEPVVVRLVQQYGYQMSKYPRDLRDKIIAPINTYFRPRMLALSLQSMGL